MLTPTSCHDAQDQLQWQDLAHEHTLQLLDLAPALLVDNFSKVRPWPSANAITLRGWTNPAHEGVSLCPLQVSQQALQVVNLVIQKDQAAAKAYGSGLLPVVVRPAVVPSPTLPRLLANDDA